MKSTLIGFLLLSFLIMASCQNVPNSGNDNTGSGNEYTHSAKKGKGPARDNYPKEEDNVRTGTADEDVINRHPGHLIYTKHARCRMDCRHIDESEVEEILEKGRINYRKSEPEGRPDPKYALEGATHDGQQVRIIFAPAKRGMVVITVIDLDNEWSCNCK